MWAGESQRTALRQHLDRALQSAPVTPDVFASYLAARETLDDDFVEALQSRVHRRAKEIPRRLDRAALRRIAGDARYGGDVRALAIRRFDETLVKQQEKWLLQQLDAPDAVLVRAAIRRLGDAPHVNREPFVQALARLARSAQRESAVRCEAIAALSRFAVRTPGRWIGLLRDENEDVVVETARTMRAWLDAGRADDCIEEIRRLRLPPAAAELLAYARQGRLFDNAILDKRPRDLAEWRKTLLAGGQAGRGRRVFFSDRVGCAKCHTVGGRGGALGPDLSRVAQSKSRLQIINAILTPSAEFPPQYQAWMVVTADGKMHRGLQLDHKSGGAIALLGDSGEQLYFRAEDIEQYAALPSSLMPSGLAETMAVSEFRDLVAFLDSLK